MTNLVGGVQSLTSGIQSWTQWLAQPNLWRRVGLVGLGGVVVLVGIVMLGVSLIGSKNIEAGVGTAVGAAIKAP